MADASLSTVLPANVLTLTFATRAFSPKAKQIEFVTSRNVIVPKPRLWLRPVPAWLVLPEELLDLIAQFLLRMLASAGMYARCSWAFKGAVTRAARLLEMDEHIIYWTGNSPPMKPPSNELSLLGNKLDDWARFTPRDFNKYMHGAEVNDIKPLLENSWCTNFTIHLCLKGSGVADHIAIRDDGDVLYSVPRLLEATLVARIGHMGMASFIATHPSWQAQLAATPFVVHPLNSHNTHWAALRVWQHGPAELFESSSGSTDLKLVHLILMLLSAYGWAPDKRVNVYHFPHFQQHDGHCCGILTAAATISLLTDRQLGVCYSDLKAWKAFLAHSIYTAIH
jgi:hypothetical protein